MPALLPLLLIATPLLRGSVQPWAVTAIELTALAAVALAAIRAWRQGRWDLPALPLWRPLAATAALLAVASVFSIDRRTSAWALLQCAAMLVVHLLALRYAVTRRGHLRLAVLAAAMGGLLSLLGLAARFDLSPLPYWRWLGFVPNPERTSATFANPDHLAGYLEMALPLGLGLLLTGGSPLRRALLVGLSLVIASALILTLSRGGWIAAAISLALMAIWLLAFRSFRRKRVLSLTVAGVLAAFFVAVASTPAVERFLTVHDENQVASIGGRVPIWQATLEMIAARPLLGFGPGTYPVAVAPFHPPSPDTRYLQAHNDYLHFVSETGCLLIPLILWLEAALLRRAYPKLEHPSRQVRGVTLGALAGMLAMAIHAIVDFNLHIPANAILFTTLAALAAGPVPRPEPRKPTAEPVVTGTFRPARIGI
jgi:O-antigen ligase